MVSRRLTILFRRPISGVVMVPALIGLFCRSRGAAAHPRREAPRHTDADMSKIEMGTAVRCEVAARACAAAADGWSQARRRSVDAACDPQRGRNRALRAAAAEIAGNVEDQVRKNYRKMWGSCVTRTE